MTWELDAGLLGTCERKGGKQGWAEGASDHDANQTDLQLAQHRAPEQRVPVRGVPPSPLNPLIAQS